MPKRVPRDLCGTLDDDSPYCGVISELHAYPLEIELHHKLERSRGQLVGDSDQRLAEARVFPLRDASPKCGVIPCQLTKN